MMPIFTVGDIHSELMNTRIFFIARLMSTLGTSGAIVMIVCMSEVEGSGVDGVESGAAAAAAAADVASLVRDVLVRVVDVVGSAVDVELWG